MNISIKIAKKKTYKKMKKISTRKVNIYKNRKKTLQR